MAEDLFRLYSVVMPDLKDIEDTCKPTSLFNTV